MVIALFCDSPVIATCGSVTLGWLGVGSADAWNTVMVMVTVRVRCAVTCVSCVLSQNSGVNFITEQH